MKSYTKYILLFSLTWNMLLFSSVQCRAASNEPETRQNTGNNNVVGLNKNQNISQSQPSDEILSVIMKQVLPQILGSLNEANGQTESGNNLKQDFSQSQNNSAVESTADVVNSAQQTSPAQNSSSAANNNSDSISVTIIPNTQETAPTITGDTQDDVAPAQKNSTADGQPIDKNYSATENTTSNEGCGNINQTVDSQPKLELDQVTTSQILYHLKTKYEDYQLDLKQGNAEDIDTYEITQKTFLREMLRSSNQVTSEHNKNIVSATYAAYYSTEYTYTFALCKLHHITKGSEEPQNPIHANISSECSKIVEMFSSFNTSYQEIFSEVTSSDGSQVLKYDNEDGKTSFGSDSDNRSNSNSSNSPYKKISTSNDETIERKNLEKNLNGYDDNNFFSRVRSKGDDFHRYDLKQSQQIGDSTYSNETRGKRSDAAAHLLSEVREIPKDEPLDDPANGSLRLRKMSNTLRTDSEADTKGHSENDDFVTDSDRLQQYNRSEKQLDQLERNYFDDDNGDIGGNIKNAKLQDVQSHYSATVEHIRDVNEQETKPKNYQTNRKTYTFKQAVEKLTSYIHILHVFVENMEKNVADSKNSIDNRRKGAYDEMHQSIYQQTFTDRQYLKEYFASTNVDSGTFSGNKTLDSVEMEAESLQTTVEKRFLWLKNFDLQEQVDSKSNVPNKMKSNPIQLLWYFEEAGFYLEHFKQSQINVPFMSYLPYPNFDVKALSDSPDGADIQFYLN